MKVVVVLGQSLNPDGTPPSTLTARIEAAATQWALHSEIILLLTCKNRTERSKGHERSASPSWCC
jgi:hypothetical protein